jgi:excinuclease ABC subunit C
MAIQDLKGQMARLPEQPGVYLFLGAGGETLYVGKARALRDRVRSYLGAAGTSPRHDALLREAAALDVIVTGSVVEALALENRLIKQRNPRYNVLLRDDKTYPYLQLTTTERAPRLLVARRVERDGNVYAGPFMPAAVARRTMSLAHRLFGIRSCNEVIDGQRGRPCLEYDIHRCLAPCVESICTIDRYRRAVDQAQLLIEGRQDELVENLRTEMTEAATEERFERAAHLRDAIRTIETVSSRHNHVESPSFGDRDAFGVKSGPAGAIVQVFQMRRGRVCDRIELATDSSLASRRDAHADDAARADVAAGMTDDSSAHASAELAFDAGAPVDLLGAAVQQFYEDRPAPPEVHLPFALDPDDQSALETWLSAEAGRRVRLVVPQRGEKRGLVDLATRNAALAYQSHFGDAATSAFAALDELRGVLQLPALPRRIEAFDISTFQGRETVASLVVAVDGRMKKSDYRKFRIRATRAPGEGSDDFAAMHEVVLRRYRRLLEHGDPYPDLILIDGGKGQLGAAYAALAEVGLERLIAVGLAKQEELLFTRDRLEGIALPPESPARLLVQRIRDEAHRFAVTFHRRARAMRDFGSELDAIPGIGRRRRAALLRAFGSLAGVRRASRADLEPVVGTKGADAVRRFFDTQ